MGKIAGKQRVMSMVDYLYRQVLPQGSPRQQRKTGGRDAMIYPALPGFLHERMLIRETRNTRQLGVRLIGIYRYISIRSIARTILITIFLSSR